MIELVVSCCLWVAIVGFGGMRAARRRRWMGRHPAPTFVFADLVGYTALTEQRGNEAAARVAREFQRTMNALSRAHGACQVKSMGDGVMICAPEAVQAVALALETVDEVGTRADLLPVRVGVHTGSAVMRGYDWYGSAVNVAARAWQARLSPTRCSSAPRHGRLPGALRGLPEAALSVDDRRDQASATSKNSAIPS